MDTEDRDHFKTIASQQAVPPLGSQMPQEKVNFHSRLDQAYCLERAMMMFSCYRKDEVHDPEIYAAAAAAVFSDYPREVIERVSDPRTGIASEYKWLPSIAEVTEFCNATVKRFDLMAQPKRVAIPFRPRPPRGNEIDSNEHMRLVEEGKATRRSVGYFEYADDEWNRGRKLMPKSESEIKKQDLIEINRIAFERECKAASVDPAKGVSPSLLNILSAG